MDDYFERMKAGDIASLEYIFRTHSEKLYAYAAGLYRESQQAEDAVQVAFFSLWEKRAKINDSDSVFGYLCRIVKNNFINDLQKEMVKQKYIEETLYYENEAIRWDDLDDIEDLRQQLWDAIDRLPEACRKIFIMNCIEGMKYMEIADQLGISLNTVKRQVKIGYKKLRSDLHRTENEVIALVALLAMFR
ncbi:MAG: RNA polymerase sigma-70 factor [Dysgonamonadaceae bacterium]|jgi:RNA polymerase sigma-70 factor (ECF subfamily)|nr:RNA polymerase sigma-70 factor [Dysgonamonadaceae bacterium]